MYINGRNAVLEALRAGETIEKIYLQYGLPEEGIEELRRAARKLGVPVTRLDRRKFRDLERGAKLGTRSQGVIARLDPVDYVEIENLVASIWERGETPLIALVDGVTDPHNLGAVIRSAECAGVHGLVIPRRNSSGITDVVAKTSAGAVLTLPIARSESLVATVKRLRESGLRVLACGEEGGAEYTGIDFREATALVLGSEGKGISADVLALCDGVIAIPMAGTISSLNVSVAAGVIFFEAARQRRSDVGDGRGH